MGSAIALALDLQANGAGPWTDRWGDLLEAANGRQLLSDEQRGRYVRSGVRLGFRVRSKILAGDPCPYEVSSRGSRVGARGSLAVWCSIQEMTFSGTPITAMAGKPLARQGIGRGGSSVSRQSFPVENGPGAYTVKATLRFEAHAGNTDSAPAFATWTEEYEAPVEVLPADAPLFVLVRDESLAEKMRTSLKVHPLILHKQTWGNTDKWAIDLRIETQGTPVGIAFDVVLKVGDREIQASAITNLAGQQMSWGSGAWDLDGPVEARTVDVILRPSLKAMKETLDQTEAWGEEIVFPSVPLNQKEK